MQAHIVAQKRVEIVFDDDVYTLYMKMTDAARQLMKEILPKLAVELLWRIPQTGTSSYFGGRKPEDGLISWQQDAITLYNLVRAVTHPYPGAFTYLGRKNCLSGRPIPRMIAAMHNRERLFRLRPLTVGTGKGLLKLLRVQLEGEEEMDAECFCINPQHRK